MKPLIFALCVVFAFGGLSAQAPVWQPSPGHTQVPIWPGTAPDAQPVAGPEESHWWPTGPSGPPGGFTVYHVSRPTMTVYSPTGKNTGAAFVVFPGGGYEDLAIYLEGTEICDWLTAKGITCVLLKYRVPGEGGYPKSAPYPKSGPYPESPMALEDAQRTMGLLRLHAAEWHIDPHMIGVLGFSAGGHLSIAAAEWDAKQGTKKFVVRHAANADKDLGLNPDVPVTRQTPPTFLVQAEDDHVDSVYDSLAYYIALKKAGVPVEMHLYAQGGHAFGLRRTKFPITGWPQLVETWLGTIGMIAE